MDAERRYRASRREGSTLTVVLAGVAVLVVTLLAVCFFAKVELGSRLVFRSTLVTEIGKQLSLYMADQGVASNRVFTPDGFLEWYRGAGIEGSKRLGLKLKMPGEGVVAIPALPRTGTASNTNEINAMLVFVPNRYSQLTKRMWFESHWTIVWTSDARQPRALRIVYVKQWYTVAAGERPVEEFFEIANAMWRSAASHDEAEFARTCARFKATDVFAGSVVPGDVVRFSGAQLDALAAVIRSQVFGHYAAGGKTGASTGTSEAKH